MNLFPPIADAYTREHLSAREAQRQAELIAWGPIVFQAYEVVRIRREDTYGCLTECRNNSRRR